ncbi:hypothetical protein [Geoalkalibacter halelectricus]|uniref:Coiled coil domain-containing protein n=1 Tax=Geoalkalibacter halelectricus TaxID=2847045 RepID=A0ABY5ZJL3_9BACT|nr:hypothetical protein [Geoalkalibacter halelectricus]MDO3378987.1 hypothetical protein [Geoalkalibacter halelectricus]UWZ78803.1 hypothetical protein L9S41_14100 [Geoalkalibacter halelectricus]
MDTRTKYVEKLSADIVEWDNQIERLKEKMEDAEPEAKAQYAQSIASLKEKRNQAAEKLQNLHVADDNEWEEVKKGAEQIWEEMKTMLKENITKH